MGMVHSNIDIDIVDHITQLTNPYTSHAGLELICGHHSYRELTQMEEKVLALGLSNVISTSRFTYEEVAMATAALAHRSINKQQTPCD